jgi:hypothetical protein
LELTVKVGLHGPVRHFALEHLRFVTAHGSGVDQLPGDFHFLRRKSRGRTRLGVVALGRSLNLGVVRLDGGREVGLGDPGFEVLFELLDLLLLGLRDTPAMGAALAVHLGVILTLFLLLPYSKMVHGLYRGLALLRFAMEKEDS